MNAPIRAGGRGAGAATGAARARTEGVRNEGLGCYRRMLLRRCQANSELKDYRPGTL
jgi:hypothetical protein